MGHVGEQGTAQPILSKMQTKHQRSIAATSVSPIQLRTQGGPRSARQRQQRPVRSNLELCRCLPLRIVLARCPASPSRRAPSAPVAATPAVLSLSLAAFFSALSHLSSLRVSRGIAHGEVAVSQFERQRISWLGVLEGARELVCGAAASSVLLVLVLVASAGVAG